MNTTVETEVPDYVLAKQELEAFYASLELRHVGDWKDTITTDKWQHNRWAFTFAPKDKDDKRSGVTLPFMTGMSIQGTPKASEVIACAARDGMSTVGVSFEDWASEFGYDTDSRKAETIFKDCEGLLFKLQNLLTQDDIEHLAALSSRL